MSGARLIFFIGLALGGALPAFSAPDLRGPEAFSGISDKGDRSRALFLEASKVMLHPRCKNCHPSGDSPTQGDEGRLHDPPVARGDHDQGIPALKCGSCHQDRNLELARVPGGSLWHLAPRSMAWAGRSPTAICEQLKDPHRNGGRALNEVVDHAAHDTQVGWAWHPGWGREPAPGTQERFGQLMAAWVETGAECPREGGKK